VGGARDRIGDCKEGGGGAEESREGEGRTEQR
jgi:hypothetical protein